MNRSSQTTGFTLLEVLIALTLVVTLMALAWSLFATFTRLETRARKQVGSLEITRSFGRQLQDDVDQLVNFSPFNLKANGRSGSDKNPGVESELQNLISNGQLELDGFEGNSLAERLELDPATSAGTEWLSRSVFQGSADSLTMLIANNNQYGSSNQQGASNPQWVVVIYEWDDANEAEGMDEVDRPNSTDDDNLESAMEDRLTSLASNRVFVRRLMSYQDFQRRNQLENQDDSNDQLDKFETIEIGRTKQEDEQSNLPLTEQVDEIPEISEISFRYFDGNSWSTFWSGSGEDLPLAIEVVFDVSSEKLANSEQADEEGMDFGDEIVIGEVDDEVPSEFEFESDSFDRRMEINPAFQPDFKRILIRVGTRSPDGISSTGTLTSDSDFESSGLEFEVER